MTIEDKDLARARAAWNHAADALTEATFSLWRLSAKRTPGTRLVFLVGDSIVRGYSPSGFGFDVADPRASDWHLDRLINIMAGGDAPFQAVFSGVIGPAQMDKLLTRHCQPGDVIVYQDWGPHASSFDAVYFGFVDFIASCAAHSQIKVIVLTGFAGTGAQPVHRWDLPFEGDTRTPNDAVRAAAERYGADLFDAHGFLSRAQACAVSAGMTLLQDDHVHLSRLGHGCLAAALYRLLGGNLSALEALALSRQERSVLDQIFDGGDKSQ